MTYPFRNLVFEGGGVKGVAFIGAIRVPLEFFLHFSGIAACTKTAIRAA
ncbi:hypothetical protein [Bacillus cereus]|uniref:Uncharacterized protein n=1 Tax=Bacillus cereus TaxID=1396 RepID=A0A0G8EQS1_BACCE|nr:hypothetical protein [Bacillus cereus]KLA26591.1 hypothetical protein B4077_2375 [Bacillus cereus]